MQLRARTDPVWFAKEVLRLKQLPAEHTLNSNPDLTWELDAWQIELMEAAADIYRKLIGEPTVINHDGKNFITVRAPHGPGKTFGAAMFMHWFNLSFNGLIACTAPKMDQLKTRLWREFSKIQFRAVRQYAGLMSVDATRITWGGKYKDESGAEVERHWIALAETASAVENLAGLHDQHIAFLVDEASGVQESLYPVIFSALSTGYLRILILIGNPTKRIGTFAASHLNADLSKDFFKIHISLDKTKRVNRKWVEQMVRQYGADSPTVRVRCYGEFADTSENQLIPLEWIERARNREFDIERGDGSSPRLRVTVDVADGGADETVVVVARHFLTHVLILRIFRFNFPSSVSPILAGEKALEIGRSWGAESGDDIVVDAMGVGAGTAGTLIKLAETDRTVPGIIPYRGGEASDGPYRNRRVQSYISLRNALRDNTITFADNALPDRQQWDELEGQLCSIRLKAEITRVDDLMTKEEMKRESMKSPDIADALAMQYATMAPRLVTGMQVPVQTVAIRSNLLENY